MTFSNDKATDADRSAYLEAADAYIEDHGSEDEPEWVLFYKGANGRKLSQTLDSASYEEALYEACNVIAA